jgi:hypothetical protein
MSMLACAMLRQLGIPAEMVSGKFAEGDSGHAFIEVYYPDAGWVFYDLSNHERGFKAPDCLMTVGEAYRAGPPGRTVWKSGYFCQSKDTVPFSRRQFQAYQGHTPKGLQYEMVLVKKAAPPPHVRVRAFPLSLLITDPSIPPGPRSFP